MEGQEGKLIFHLFFPLLSTRIFIIIVLQILIHLFPSDFLLAHWFMSVHGQTSWRASSRKCEGKSQKENTFKACTVMMTVQKKSNQWFYWSWSLSKVKMISIWSTFFFFSLKIKIFESSYKNNLLEVFKTDSKSG